MLTSVKYQGGNPDFDHHGQRKRHKKNNLTKQSFQVRENLCFEEIIDDLVIRFIMNVPEEEFESFDRLFFQIEEAHWYYHDFYQDSNENLPSLTFEEFVEKIFERCPALSSHREAAKKYIQSFYQYKRAVPVYGAIILNRSCDKVVLVRGYNAKTWSFPRGKINQNEPELVCATREVKEETGFDISPYINSEDFIEMNSNDHLVKLFIVVGIPEDVRFVPESRNEISDIRWHSLATIDKNPKHYYLVNCFIPLLKKWLQEHRNMKPTASHHHKIKGCFKPQLTQTAVFHDSQ